MKENLEYQTFHSDDSDESETVLRMLGSDISESSFI